MLARRIEEASLNAWPAPQQVLHDGWVIRLANGYTRRANSVTPLYPAALGLEVKIAYCERVYRERALPPIFRLTSVADVPGLDEALTRRGYRAEAPTLVLHLDLAEAALPAPSTPLYRTTPEAWLPIYTRTSGGRPADESRHASILRAIVPETYAVHALAPDSTPAACGLAVREGDVVGVFDLVTAPARRRQGYGGAILAELLRWAREAGARHAYLQVMSENAPARRLYERLGFTELYHYWYRVG